MTNFLFYLKMFIRKWKTWTIQAFEYNYTDNSYGFCVSSQILSLLLSFIIIIIIIIIIFYLKIKLNISHFENS